MRAMAAFLAAGVLVSGTSHAGAETAPAPVTVKVLGLPCADCNEGERTTIKSGGRVTYGYMHQWPGAYWEADITGASFMVVFNDKANIFGVYADGRKIDTQVKPGYVVEYRGLSEGRHRIRVETQTESQSAEYTGVTDIEVPFKTPVLPAPSPRARQIEFVGDSITVGYGNTSGKRACTRDEVWATTDTSQAFGPLTAKHFDADYEINAISGRGIVRNYNGFASPHLPEAYPYALLDGKTKVDDSGWRPQLLVVWLGTNDFSTPLNAGEKWPNRQALQADYEATYVAFVQSLRARNPNAFFILMAQGLANGELPTEVQKVIKRLSDAGERRIAFLPAPSLHFGGCDGHPDTGDDRAIADSLIAFIDAKPDIWK